MFCLPMCSFVSGSLITFSGRFLASSRNRSEPTGIRAPLALRSFGLLNFARSFPPMSNTRHQPKPKPAPPHHTLLCRCHVSETFYTQSGRALDCTADTPRIFSLCFVLYLRCRPRLFSPLCVAPRGINTPSGQLLQGMTAAVPRCSVPFPSPSPSPMASFVSLHIEARSQP